MRVIFSNQIVMKNMRNIWKLVFLTIPMAIILGCESGVDDGDTPGSPVNPEIFVGWWTVEWSLNNTGITIVYAEGSNSISINQETENLYDPFGNLVGKNVQIHKKGEDIYGREQDINTQINYKFIGGNVKPDVLIRNGTIVYPPEEGLVQRAYSITLNEEITFKYNDIGHLEGGSYSEEFYGHVSTNSSIIEFSGSAFETLVGRNGVLLFTERTEKTTYYKDDKMYAETETVITPESEYLGGTWLTTSESYEIVTDYADNTERITNLVILWNRNEYGITTGKSGNGLSNGTEIINEKEISYSGSIDIHYGFDGKIGWYKNGYDEERTDDYALAQRLPFEIIFIDDYDLR
jgi:hypothetical protein